MSVATLIYDLWDTNIDGVDTGSIGFGPILDVMTGPQIATDAFTTLFTFGNAMRSQLGGADLALLDALLTAENTVTGTIDDWGTNQDQILAVPNQNRDVLPLYTDLPVNGTTINVCANSDFDVGQDGNKLAEYRYLRISVNQRSRYTIRAETSGTGDSGTSVPSQPPPGFDCDTAFAADPDDPAVHTYSDPDFLLFNSGQIVWGGQSCTPNLEVTTTNVLNPGNYVLDIADFRHADPDTIDGYPERICFDVSMSPL